MGNSSAEVMSVEHALLSQCVCGLKVHTLHNFVQRVWELMKPDTSVKGLGKSAAWSKKYKRITLVKNGFK